METDMKYAVVEIKSGIQEKLSEGDIIKVPGFIGEQGDKIQFDRVMFFRNGKDISIGEPLVKGIKVKGEVISHKKGTKIKVFKMESKKNYRRTRGSREMFTEVKILKIGQGE